MKKIISILICVCILMCSLAACADSYVAEAKAEIEEDYRFYIVDTVKIEREFLHDTAHIMVDRYTNICYLYTVNGYRGGITVLLDSDGKPLIWEE